MVNTDAIFHVKGESQFVDDRLTPEGTLYAAVFTSPVAHGKITKINTASAKKLNGVIRIFTASDIPGENQIGNIIQDEVLLAENEVHYIGQPIAIVVGTKPEIAQKGIKSINAILYDKCMLPPMVIKLFNPSTLTSESHKDILSPPPIDVRLDNPNRFTILIPLILTEPSISVQSGYSL